MPTVTTFLPVLALLAIGWAGDRWSKRPSARARWAALSLRDKITRTIRAHRIAIAQGGGWLVLFAALRLAGILPFGGWLAGTTYVAGNLAIVLYLLRNALAARRTYNSLGPLAYLAEVQHAFGSTSPGPSDDGVVNGMAWHTQPGKPCERCRLALVHYDTCDCGHCPPPVPRGTVLHVSLSGRLAASMPEVFGSNS